MNTFVMKFQTLLVIQTLVTRCNTILVNATLFVDKGDTVVLNCTRFCANGTSWEGPGMPNETVLLRYSDGLLTNPYLKLTNIAIYGNFTRGTCHMQIKNFSTANDGIYQCIYIVSGNINIRRYKVFSKRPPTNLKIVNVSENNIIYGKEGVRMELKCRINTGIPAATTLIWSKQDLTVSNGSRESLVYQFTPTRFDHMQNMTCYAVSDLLTTALSQTIRLDIKHRPYLTIIRSKNGPIIEGESAEMCCQSNSNPNVNYIVWNKNNDEVFSWRPNATTKSDGRNKTFCLPISTFYRNHTGIYTCFAENIIGKSTSYTGITVLYAPDVNVTYTNSENSIILHCIPDGYPYNYTFYDWEHRSEYNEHIRRIHGTPDGQLIIHKSQIRKAIEDDGIYACAVSNGVANKKGILRQEGQICVESSDRPYLTIIRSKNGPIIEGESAEMCCQSNSNPNVNYIVWNKNNDEVFSWRPNATTKSDGRNKTFCLPISTFYRNHTGIYTCFAENIIGKSTSYTGITVLYAPDVNVTYTNSENSIILHCIPDGYPYNYTFYDWEHRSEYNEHIRRIHGTPDGQLIIHKSQIRKAIEDDGIYACAVSNGVANKKGILRQEGQICVESSASPVFIADNEPIQIGHYGQKVKLTIKIYDKLYNSKVLIKENDISVRLRQTIENITAHDTFHGVRIRVHGIQYTFHMHLALANDFTNYTVEACNEVGCNYFYIQVNSADTPISPNNISVRTTRQKVIVSWCPNFNGGFEQEFFLEYREKFRFTFTLIGPIKDTKEEKMNYSIKHLSPNTAYLIRIFSRNKIGDSGKTNNVVFKTLSLSKKSEKYCHSDWKIVGSLFGGFFILSICLNIFCLLKRKRSSRMVPEIQLEVQYNEIGISNNNHASILSLSNSVQEAETSVYGAAVEETYPQSTSLKQNDSSDNSVQSLSTSLLSWDGYEHPYQSIDPADIEIHPYSTVGSYLYQNTIVFQRQRSSRNPNHFIPNEEKRVPWLVIYKSKKCKFMDLKRYSY